jgi:hypothetical protein
MRIDYRNGLYDFMFLYPLFDNLLDGMVRLWGISGVSLGLSVFVGWFGLGKRADLGFRC